MHYFTLYVVFYVTHHLTETSVIYADATICKTNVFKIAGYGGA